MDKSTYFSNPTFLLLLTVIIVLLALIAVVGSVFRNISQSDLFNKPSDKNDNAGGKALGMLLLFLLSAIPTFSQTNNAPVAKDPPGYISGIDPYTFFTLIGIIMLEASILYTLILTIKKLLATEEKQDELKPVNIKKERTIIDKFNASIDIEKEEDIMFDHEYDGIRELDNDLPPWWKYGFYLTIVVSVVYLFNFHISKTGDLQDMEYKKDVEQAEAAKAAYMASAANNVDETSVKLLTDPADIAAGKNIFEGTCATCHLKLGEGSVGPNLTDDYWLHGGSIQDIFKTIKYGYPDKGMKSWKDDYSPVQIAQLASFIKSIRGTNPPNAKAPQGELYTEQGMVSDSLKVDSLNIILPADSLKKDSTIAVKK
ncbi:MAG: cbb3-type cytochrome c oxidase N-terminal domain-containing protein [Bacteroidia bacterium]